MVQSNEETYKSRVRTFYIPIDPYDFFDSLMPFRYCEIGVGGDLLLFSDYLGEKEDEIKLLNLNNS